MLTSDDWFIRMHSPNALISYLNFVEENVSTLIATPQIRFKVIRDITQISVAKNIPVSFQELKKLIAKFEPYIFIDTKDAAERNYVVNKWMQLQFLLHPWPTAIVRIHAYAKQYHDIFLTSLEWMMLAYLIEDNSDLRFPLPPEVESLDNSKKFSLLIYQHVNNLLNTSPVKFFAIFEDCYRDLENSYSSLINFILHYQKNIGEIEQPLVMDSAMQTRLRHQIAMSYLDLNFMAYVSYFNGKAGLKEYLDFFDRALKILESINFPQVVSYEEISIETLNKILEIGVLYPANISNQMISRLVNNIQKLSPSIYYALMFSVMKESNDFNRRVQVELHGRSEIPFVHLHADIKIMEELKQYPALLAHADRVLLTQNFEIDVAEENSYFLLDTYSHVFEAMFAEKGMEVTLKAVIDFYNQYPFLTRSKHKATPYIIMLVEHIVAFAHANEGFPELRSLISENWQVSRLIDLKGNMPYAELDVANKKVSEHVKVAAAKTNRSIPVAVEFTNTVDSRWLYLFWLFCIALAAYGIYGKGASFNQQKTNENVDKEKEDETKGDKSQENKLELKNKKKLAKAKQKDSSDSAKLQNPPQEKPEPSDEEKKKRAEKEAEIEKQRAELLAADEKRKADAQKKIMDAYLEEERNKQQKKYNERQRITEERKVQLLLEKQQQDRADRETLLKNYSKDGSTLKNVANKIIGAKKLGNLTKSQVELAVERFFALESNYLLESSIIIEIKDLRAVDSFASWIKDEFLEWWEEPGNQARVIFPVRNPLPAAVRAPAAQLARPDAARVPAPQPAVIAAARAPAAQPAVACRSKSSCSPTCRTYRSKSSWFHNLQDLQAKECLFHNQQCS